MFGQHYSGYDKQISWKHFFKSGLSVTMLRLALLEKLLQRHAPSDGQVRDVRRQGNVPGHQHRRPGPPTAAVPELRVKDLTKFVIFGSVKSFCGIFIPNTRIFRRL